MQVDFSELIAVVRDGFVAVVFFIGLFTGLWLSFKVFRP